MKSVEFDANSPAVRNDPYPHYDRIREAGAVVTLSMLGGVIGVSHHDEVVFVLKHPELFSSAQRRQLAAKMNLSMGEEITRMMEAQALVGSDPPVHTRLRGLVSRAFTPQRIAAMEPRVRAITRELLSAAAARGEMELIRDLAGPLPVRVIAELLGVEPERHRDFKRWSDVLISVGDALKQGGDPAPIEASLRELRLYLEGVIAARRESPRDDLISALLSGGEQEGILTPDDVVAFANLLLIAGNETTTYLIANGVLTLLAHPGEWRKLVDKPALIPNAVEEILRFEPPAQAVFRTAMADVPLGGEVIPKGAAVFALLGAANRDPKRYPDPARFDVTRDASGHVAFGFGIHFCLGAPLSRLEAKVVFEELAAQMPDLAHEGGMPEAIPWLPAMFMRGPKEVRLRFGEKRAAGRG